MQKILLHFFMRLPRIPTTIVEIIALLAVVSAVVGSFLSFLELTGLLCRLGRSLWNSPHRTIGMS